MGAIFEDIKLVHQTPLRARFKYKKSIDINFESLKCYLEVIEGVKSVRINHISSSIIFEYENLLDVSQLETILINLNDNLISTSNEELQENPRLISSAIALGVTPFLPEILKLPISTLATYKNILSGLGGIFENGIDSEVLESLAILISLYRKDYFAANTTNFLLELGEFIEESIARKSDSMLKSLLTPDIKQIWIERDKEEVLVDANEVKRGDIVIVMAGAIVPIDGTVVGGDALVDESSLTGESVPVAKARGDRAISGTMLKEGRLRIWAESVGEQSAVYRIANYVQSSLKSKSSAQIEANAMADKLVPIILGLAGFSYFVSKDITRVASVFQADYSCALKLATPVAFKSGMYSAGKSGALIKGADVFERLANVDTFVFDKTGTLSSGDLVVCEVFCLDEEWSNESILSLAASIEEHYFHPIAEAVVKAANKLDSHTHFRHSEVEFIVAHGVSAYVDNAQVLIGSRHFLEEDNSISFTKAEEIIENEYKKGRTLLYIGYQTKLLGIISLSDNIREESFEMIENLRKLGIKEIVMLTGDHSIKAKEISDKLGLDRFYAELLPEDKMGIVKELKESGKKVAFVGDGINDAPSLALSDVGISMQKGADLARVTADIALLEDDISIVADVKKMANETIALVNQNFYFTVGANSLILMCATLGLINPVTTSILHNGTTIAILLNALKGVKSIDS